MEKEPGLFDKIEAEEKAAAAAEKQRQLLAGFKFLDHDFVLEVTGRSRSPFRPVVYSPEFTSLVQTLDGIRDRVQSGEIDIHAAFKEAAEAEQVNGFDPKLKLGADGKIDASEHIKAFRKEVDALRFYPSYPSHADSGELSSARSELAYRERREVEKAAASLSLKPLFAYAVDEDKLSYEIMSHIRDAIRYHIGNDDAQAIVGWRGVVNLSDVAQSVIEMIRDPFAQRGVMIRPKEAAPA